MLLEVGNIVANFDQKHVHYITKIETKFSLG